MPIKKMPNGKYKVDISIGFDPITGARRRKTKIATTKKEAEEIYYRIKSKYRNGELDYGKNTNFKYLIAVYFNHMEQHLKEVTVHNRTLSINKHIVPYFKNSLVNKITYTEITNFRQHLINQDLKISTINQLMVILHNIFSTGVKEGLVKKNPCSDVKNLRDTSNKIIIWTPEDFKLFINFLNPKQKYYKTLYTFAYLTGTRIGEAQAVTWEDLDTTEGIIIINKTYHRINKKDIVTTPKTPNSIRSISINKKLTDMLLNLRTQQKNRYEELGLIHTPQTPIFEKDGKIPSTHYINQLIKDTCHKINNSTNQSLKVIKFHGFRHSHVSLLIHQGEELLLISERLGHKSVSFTLDTYGHLFPSRQKQLSNKLDSLSFL